MYIFTYIRLHTYTYMYIPREGTDIVGPNLATQFAPTLGHVQGNANLDIYVYVYEGLQKWSIQKLQGFPLVSLTFQGKIFFQPRLRFAR